MTATPTPTLTFDGLRQRYPYLFAPAAWSNCPRGWIPLLADLCARITSEAPDTQFTQVKDKFAALRIYCIAASERADALIEEAEKKSMSLCEKCGAPGSRCTVRGWLHVRCEEHAL